MQKGGIKVVYNVMCTFGHQTVEDVLHYVLV